MMLLIDLAKNHFGQKFFNSGSRTRLLVAKVAKEEEGDDHSSFIMMKLIYLLDFCFNGLVAMAESMVVKW